MISKLAKNIAHFFVVQNITEESKEVIYAYGPDLSELFERSDL